MRAIVFEPWSWVIWYGTTAFVVGCRYAYQRSQKRLSDAKDRKNAENSWPQSPPFEPMMATAAPVVEGEIIDIRTDKPEWMS
jgi:hypothetical protein